MKALIIDDEPMPAKHLQSLIQKHCFEITSTEMIHSPIDALEHLKTHTYDLIFLDVEMPEVDGFELLDRAELPSSTQVIFTTAYSQYAVNAFKANAAHYILKMVSKDELINAVRKALRFLDKGINAIDHRIIKNEAISIFDGDEHHIIRLDDIIRLEADGSYSKIVLKERELLSSKGIGFYDERLPSDKFIRCHNSHIINIYKIIRLSKGRKGYLIMTNEDSVPLSPTRKDELESKLGL